MQYLGRSRVQPTRRRRYIVTSRRRLLAVPFFGGRQSRLCLRAPPSSSCVIQGVCFVARFEGIGKPPIRLQKIINAPLNKEAHGIIFFWRAKHRLYIVCMINSAIVTHTHNSFLKMYLDRECTWHYGSHVVPPSSVTMKDDLLHQEKEVTKDGGTTG